MSMKRAGGKPMTSEYLYPGTNVLKNHFGIQDQVKLDNIERYHTAYRAIELRFNSAPKAFDLNYLKDLHSHLFQDVYPFAGQLRTVNIGKNNFWFCDTSMISRLGDQVFSELKGDKFLKGLAQDEFANKAAYYYTEINYMHPFREGNGRAIREFFEQLSKNAGYELNWQNVPTNEYFQAVKMTDDPKQLSELVNVFNKCLSPINVVAKEQAQWIEPPGGIQLKELLKSTDGLPAAKANIDVEALRKTVDRFQINEKGSFVRVQFNGESILKTIPLEKHPHLSAVKKNLMLDQAAAGTKMVSQISKYLEP